MKPRFTMREALSDPQLLAHAMPGASWAVWKALLIASMGEALTPTERKLFTLITGRPREPLQRCDELWLAVGRRGGKSRALAVLASYLSACIDYSDVLSPGEGGIALVCAVDQRQAGIIASYAEAMLAESPILAQQLRGRSGDTIELAGSIFIEVRWSNFRRVRGPTCIACIIDEVAFLPNDEASASPDSALLEALRPTLATTGGPLIASSSPYARRGELWLTYRRHYGPDGDKLIIVAQAASRVTNPSLSQRVVDRALERDPVSAAAEYLAQFRSDLEGYIAREALDALVSNGVKERPPLPGIRYVAFVDMAGGSGRDSATLAIAHRQQGHAVLDYVAEKKPPFKPSAVVAEFGAALRRYLVSRIHGDRFGGEWPREPFKVRGIDYYVSEKDKSGLYLALLPSLNSGLVDLLDNDRLLTQLSDLERRVRSGGRDIIDHPPKGRDDIANAVAGAIVLALGRRGAAPDTFAAPVFIPLAGAVASGVGGASARWLDH